MLYVILGLPILRLLGLLRYILSYHAESCLLLRIRLQNLERHVAASVLYRLGTRRASLYRKYRQEWREVSDTESEAPMWQAEWMKWPLE